jgi:hypothetical protein
MLADRIAEILVKTPGLTDRQLSEVLYGTRDQCTTINGECRYMKQQGKLDRKKRDDGLIGNYLACRKPKLTLV